MLRTSLALLLHFTLRYWKIALFVVIIPLLGLAISYYLANPPSNNQQTDDPTYTFPYEDIEVGYTTHEELIERYGLFDYEYVEDGTVVYAYASDSSRYAPDLFYLRNDVVRLKELYFNPLERKLPLDSVSRPYGTAEAVLYSSTGTNTYNAVYVYATKGLAIFTRESNVTRLQYFSPMPLEQYRSTWGADLLESAPTPTQEPAHTAN